MINFALRSMPSVKNQNKEQKKGNQDERITKYFKELFRYIGRNNCYIISV